MLMSVYLHDEISAILSCYGTLDEVINRVLEAGAEGEFDLTNKPQIPSREGARRFEVDVKNEEYLTLLKIYPQNSTKVSLRRLLYWFVENEMYDILGWEVVNKYVDRNDRKRMKMAKRIRQEVESLLQVVDIDTQGKLQNTIELLKELEK